MSLSQELGAKRILLRQCRDRDLAPFAKMTGVRK